VPEKGTKENNSGVGDIDLHPSIWDRLNMREGKQTQREGACGMTELEARGNEGDTGFNNRLRKQRT